MTKKYAASDLAVLLFLLGFLLLFSVGQHFYLFALVVSVLLILLSKPILAYWVRAKWILAWLGEHGGRIKKDVLFLEFQRHFGQENGNDAALVFDSSLGCLMQFFMIRQPEGWVALYSFDTKAGEGATFLLKADGEAFPIHSARDVIAWQPEPELNFPKPRRVITWQDWIIPLAILAITPFPPAKVSYPWGICLSLALLAVFGVSVWAIRANTRLLSIGDPVAGLVEYVTIQSGGGRNSSRIETVTCSYRYQGKPFQKDLRSGMRVSRGDVLTLLVDPSDPNNVIIYLGNAARMKTS